VPSGCSFIHWSLPLVLRCSKAEDRIEVSEADSRRDVVDFYSFASFFTTDSQSEYKVRVVFMCDRIMSAVSIPNSSIVYAEIASRPDPLVMCRVIMGRSIQ